MKFTGEEINTTHDFSVRFVEHPQSVRVSCASLRVCIRFWQLAALKSLVDPYPSAAKTRAVASTHPWESNQFFLPSLVMNWKSTMWAYILILALGESSCVMWGQFSSAT